MKQRIIVRTPEQVLIGKICELASEAEEDLENCAPARVLASLRDKAKEIFYELDGMTDEAIEAEATCSSCDGLGEDPRTDTPCGNCNGKGGWNREEY